MTTEPTIDKAHQSPNRGGYAHKHEARCVVWHITQGRNSLGWLCNPESGASSNYLIRRDGHIYELVPPNQSAWANGRTCFPDRDEPVVAQALAEHRNLNTVSVSIEHEGFTSAGRGGSLTKEQVDATVALTAWLCDQWGIPPTRDGIIGHFAIDSCDRPNCPGFSDAEWALWVGRVSVLVGGEGEREEVNEVKEPAAGTGQGYLNARGELIAVVNFGGQAREMLGVNFADLGGSVRNDEGAVYDRSLVENIMQPWVRRP